MKYNTFNNKNVLITGGASGIGFEFARLFLNDKATVILIDKDKSLLDKAENELGKMGGIVIYHKDLSEPQTHLEIFEDLKKRGIGVNVLINNVAIHRHGSYVNLKWKQIIEIIKVNVICTLHFCHLFLPLMIKDKEGIVLNISSTAGLVVCPELATYSATKAFVNRFSEALAVELKGSGVKVHWICAGATATDFFKSAGMADTDYVRTVKKMSASQVAAEGMNILKCNRLWKVIGKKNQFNIFISNLLPEFAVRYIAKKRFK